eukprot:gnl/TRDRNA2_/TRDRNA2_189380_c0_seq1.p1 gnl/TRDRNA2_/TRDRNA2_189380_c0~~gnl/TRDRNA2_/TRDRNA2_189380_c0_seq1.p1  ORF type:complete len:249 (+),score=47.51 gnl/TRDRNA2_/TRDRNA2_189380_c0_seq1:47-793(+)
MTMLSTRHLFAILLVPGLQYSLASGYSAADSCSPPDELDKGDATALLQLQLQKAEKSSLQMSMIPGVYPVYSSEDAKPPYLTVSSKSTCAKDDSHYVQLASNLACGNCTDIYGKAPHFGAKGYSTASVRVVCLQNSTKILDYFSQGNCSGGSAFRSFMLDTKQAHAGALLDGTCVELPRFMASSADAQRTYIKYVAKKGPNASSHSHHGDIDDHCCTTDETGYHSFSDSPGIMRGVLLIAAAAIGMQM